MKPKEKKISEDINELPFSEAIKIDKRNIFIILYSFLIQKLELIGLFATTHKIKIIIVLEYILSLLTNFFVNSLLYSDDVVSHKYHNNGELNLIVTLTLSISSNIITSLFFHFVKYSRGIEERINLVLEFKYKDYYLDNINKFFIFLRIKFICFFIFQLIIIFVCLYYIVIFCILYKKSQISLIINYCYSLVESIIIGFAISLIILITRKIGLSYKNKDFYNVSKYINSKF